MIKQPFVQIQIACARRRSKLVKEANGVCVLIRLDELICISSHIFVDERRMLKNKTTKNASGCLKATIAIAASHILLLRCEQRFLPLTGVDEQLNGADHVDVD